MRSTSGEHYLALDHVRALAAFIVFCWHFLHGFSGQPVALGFTPAVFPLALLDEGHTGVALFMTLSGYLFAKLLDGKRMHYGWFIWNRLVRIVPLLLLVIGGIGLYRYLADDGFQMYLQFVKLGWLLPTLPNGAWSVTVELHFYLVLPLILVLSRRSIGWLVALLVAALLLRTYLHHRNGEVQTLSYLTLVGRIDQFLLGILAFHLRRHLRKRHWLAAATGLAFLAFYWYFDLIGGFISYPSYPSPSRLWIVLPALEGIAYATLIAYYDSSFQPGRTGLSGLIGRFGTYSYSIYLLHFFLVFRMSAFIGSVMDLSNFYVACAWSLACFCLMYPVGYLSYRFVEEPFLRLRHRYAISSAGTATLEAGGREPAR
ncbi:MAG: acyltransferase [Lysobacteraceae bacterium]|nr:MAG: acyltransferase [Xanthomonadaceae bacterium]